MSTVHDWIRTSEKVKYHIKELSKKLDLVCQDSTQASANSIEMAGHGSRIREYTLELANIRISQVASNMRIPVK